MVSSEWNIAKCLFPTHYSPLPTPSFAHSRRFRGELLALLDRLLDGADHVKGVLRQVVVLALAQALEAADRIGEVDEHAGRAGEHLGHMEGLRQEAFDLAGTRDGDLILFRE